MQSSIGEFSLDTEDVAMSKYSPYFQWLLMEKAWDNRKFVFKVTNTEWYMHVLMINGADTFIWLGRSTGYVK